MAFNPLFIIHVFFCIFQMNFAVAKLDLKKMGKFLWEGREKILPSWLSQFSFATWYSIFEVDAMPLSLKNLLIKDK